MMRGTMQPSKKLRLDIRELEPFLALAIFTFVFAVLALPSLALAFILAFAISLELLLRWFIRCIIIIATVITHGLPGLLLFVFVFVLIIIHAGRWLCGCH